MLYPLSYSSGVERGRIPATDGTNAANRALPRSNWCRPNGATVSFNVSLERPAEMVGASGVFTAI